MQSGIGRRRESDIAQEKQNLHAGHRQRLKKRFDAVGLKGFEEHTLLELLLFYAIPQKDTNALAHELIRRFGSLDGVLQAGMAQLMQVNGVGENAARMLKVVAAVCQSCGQGLWEDRRPVLAISPIDITIAALSSIAIVFFIKFSSFFSAQRSFLHFYP